MDENNASSADVVFISVKKSRAALLTAGSLAMVVIPLVTAFAYATRYAAMAIVLIACGAFFLWAGYWHARRLFYKGRQGLLLTRDELEMLGPKHWSLKRADFVAFNLVTIAANRVVGFKLRSGVRNPTQVLGGLLGPRSDLYDGFLPNYLEVSPDQLYEAARSWLGNTSGPST